jgi:putative adhesin
MQGRHELKEPESRDTGKPYRPRVHPIPRIERRSSSLWEQAVIRFAVAATSAALLFSPTTATHLAEFSARRAAVISADTSPSFSWNGSVPAGGWVRIRNISGSIEVRRGAGNVVEVHADREPNSDRWSWFSGPTEAVRFVTQRQGSDVVVCATSQSIPKCDANDLSSPEMGWGDNWHPQAMHVVVQLPAGVSLQAGTMHGDLTITDAGGTVTAATGHGSISIHNAAGLVTANSGHGNVEIVNAASRVVAYTGHGDMRVSSRGAVRATTGHGDIVADIAPGAVVGSDDLVFETGHGNVRVSAPRSLRGDVDLHTGRGRVSSDFPLSTNNDDRNERSGSAHGIIGGGGPSVRLSSGHGDVSLTSS